MSARAPEQVALPFIADEAITRIFDMLNSPHRPGDSSRACAALWARLDPFTRITWLHAACIDGGECLSRWEMFSVEERGSLLAALESLVEFFQKIGSLTPLSDAELDRALDAAVLSMPPPPGIKKAGER
jgi:hypothetical protein